MRVNNQFSLFAGQDAINGGRAGRNAAAGRQGGSVYAAFLNGEFDPIEQKRALAKKQAYKIVGDTFASQKKLDGELADRAARIDEHKGKLAEANRTIKEIEEKKEELRKEYGVDADSQEQKDLEILEQYNRNNRNSELFKPLTGEEMLRAAELDAQGYGKGYTEYQKRALEWDAGKDKPLMDLMEAKKGIYEEAGTIRAMNLERLKKEPMLDAQKEAEEILEGVSDEIIGMLVDEAKDQIDEKSKEEIEKVQERREEKKEELEKLEKAKERREELEARLDPEKAKEKERRRPEESDQIFGDSMTEGLLIMDEAKNTVQQEVADIMMKMKLVAEDVKGIKVDELL